MAEVIEDASIFGFVAYRS